MPSCNCFFSSNCSLALFLFTPCLIIGQRHGHWSTDLLQCPWSEASLFRAEQLLPVEAKLTIPLYAWSSNTYIVFGCLLLFALTFHFDTSFIFENCILVDNPTYFCYFSVTLPIQIAFLYLPTFPCTYLPLRRRRLDRFEFTQSTCRRLHKQILWQGRCCRLLHSCPAQRGLSWSFSL